MVDGYSTRYLLISVLHPDIPPKSYNFSIVNHRRTAQGANIHRNEVLTALRVYAMIFEGKLI